MHKVVLSIASNRFQKANLLKARQRLGEMLVDVKYTSELWTEPSGSCRRDLYLNQLACGSTTLTEQQLNEQLKQVESDFGRDEVARRLGIVPIDLDILMFNNQRRHLADWDRHYVKSLLNECEWTATAQQEK